MKRLIIVLTLPLLLSCDHGYSSCEAARAAHAAPLHQSDSGWNPGLDHDGDGVACE